MCGRKIDKVPVRVAMACLGAIPGEGVDDLLGRDGLAIADDDDTDIVENLIIDSDWTHSPRDPALT